MPKSYYDILEITRTATEKDVKSAFRKLARKHHPDVNGDPEKFREIYKAYETLIDAGKRAKYDKLGHEEYEQEPKSDVKYPSYEEIFKEMVKKAISTETPVDQFVSSGYPGIYIGGEGFEDPYTGDLWSSAEDIRIAKMERALFLYNSQMQTVRNNIYGEIESLYKLRMLGGTLFNMKWLTEAELDKDLQLINEYEIKDREYRAAKLTSERTQELGYPIQEKVELQHARNEKEIKNSRQLGIKKPGYRNDFRSGHRHGEDPDKRSAWRKETDQGMKLR